MRKAICVALPSMFDKLNISHILRFEINDSTPRNLNQIVIPINQ